MFITTYGVVRHEYANPKNFHFKVIDLENGVEVFKVGRVRFDCEEKSNIFIISIDGKLIPFLVDFLPIVHSALDLREINPERNPKSDRVTIDVASLIFSEVGVNLKKRYPPIWDRDESISYIERFSECTGYNLNPDEKSRIINYIKEALPLFYFDDFMYAFTPFPIICIDVVDGENEKIKLLFPKISNELAKEKVDKIRGKISYRYMVRDIKKYLDLGKYRLETLLSDAIHVEREFLINGYWGAIHFPRPITLNQDVWKVLRVIYTEDYSNVFETFELFLIQIINIFDSRAHERAFYIRDCYWKNKIVGHP